jgi:hypothetical protein
MNVTSLNCTALIMIILCALSGPLRIGAQVMMNPYPAPPTLPQSPRQLLDQIRTQLHWLESATRTSSMFNTGADVLLWRHYDGLGVSFRAFQRSLSPQQQEFGANNLAELDAGLAIIGEAFANFQDDLNQGRHGTVAFRTLCQVLRDSARVWGQEMNRVARQLQVG